MTTTTAVSLDYANRVYGLGLCVVRPLTNGSKMPEPELVTLAQLTDLLGKELAEQITGVDEEGQPRTQVRTWKHWQYVRPPIAQVRMWFRDGYAGIGILTGSISNNVILFEFDCYQTYLDFKATAQELGLSELVERIERGYCERTPGEGIHWLIRCEVIAGNESLARRPTEGKKFQVLIETRAEGGFAILAPSGGPVHPTGGAYELLSGGLESIAEITAEEREELWQLARSFDQTIEERSKEPPRTTNQSTRLLPGADFNQRATWEQVLEPHGWTKAAERGRKAYWKRSGTDHRWSATTGHTENNTLMVFSTSTVFKTAPSSYSLWAAYTYLNHDGDFTASSEALYELGYGERRTDHPLDGDTDDDERLDRRLEIRVNDRPFDTVVDLAVFALRDHNDPPKLFVRDGVLARVCRDEDDRPTIASHSVDSLRYDLAHVAYWHQKTGKRVHEIAPPGDVVRAVLARGEWRDIPSLAGITQTPVLHQDGTIHDQEGYDPISQMWYAPPTGFTLPRMSERPNDGDVRGAVTTLTEPFCDFPFIGDADKAGALSAVITATLRPFIPGPTPLHAFDKPRAGSGASLLAEVVSHIATGAPAQMKTLPKDRGDEETRKVITAALMSGNTTILFDNVDSAIGSGHLAAAITARVWEDRILGRSETVRLPVRVMWLATANNFRVRGDFARRCVVARLDAHVERPWERTDFKHPDLLAYVTANRDQLLAAVLTLARAWIKAGRPAGENPILGSFEAWSTIVGGILTTAGIKGFLSNLATFYEAADEDYSEWSTFLVALHGWSGGQPFTVAALATALGIDTNSGLRDSLPGFLADKLGKPTLRHALGRAMATKDEARYDGLRLVKVGTTHRAVQWQVMTDPKNAPSSGGQNGESGESGESESPFSAFENEVTPPTSEEGECQTDSPDSPVTDCRDCGARLVLSHRKRGFCQFCWKQRESDV
jgi:hypothetical protein